MRRARRAAAVRILAGLAVGLSTGLFAVLAASPAAIAHHSILVREVAASTSSPDAAFVELQTYRQGQNNLTGSEIVVYSALGLSQIFPLGGELASADSQRSILIADTAVGPADFTYPALGGAMSPGGGAVCLPEATPPDCVSWGTFSGSLPFPGAGSPAPAIPDGRSLTRTIARGCALGLDQADDSDVSAADFALTTPSPRPSSAPPSERSCVPCGGANATLTGTEGRDVLRGTSRRDVIAALAGADVVRGLAGRDTICGGIGKDTLVGGGGRDRLLGGRGRDLCKGGRGRDKSGSCEVVRGL
ncbi:MAG TPA: hypothetical protein VHH72_06805 [Solirubrobacterales bacterium]|nr:hypothetical protein [Solirubrobacterales bacterium]